MIIKNKKIRVLRTLLFAIPLDYSYLFIVWLEAHDRDFMDFAEVIFTIFLASQSKKARIVENFFPQTG